MHADPDPRENGKGLQVSVFSLCVKEKVCSPTSFPAYLDHILNRPGWEPDMTSKELMYFFFFFFAI